MAKGVIMSGVVDADQALQHKQLAHLEEIQSAQQWYDLDGNKRLKRLTLEMVSENSNSLLVVSKALVTAIAEGKLSNENGYPERDPRGECINIAGFEWENRAQLKAQCQEILRRYAPDPNERNAVPQPLEDAEFEFMRALLQHHPRARKKLRDCQAIVVDSHRDFKARCFYVVRTNGEREDFSYVRCVDNAPTEEMHGQQQITSVLSSVLKLHPGSCEEVAKIIESSQPNYRGDEGSNDEMHRNWTRCIIELCRTVPDMTEYLFAVLIRRMLELDAAIMKLEDSCEPEESFGGGEQSEAPPAEEGWPEQDIQGKIEQLDAMAHILDAMMSLFFEFLEETVQGEKDCNGNLLPATDRQKRLARSLFGIFQSVVLLTHRARCVQFIWFYLAALRPEWTEDFLTLLLHTAFSPNQAIPKRLTSVAYLASFVARGRFLNLNFVVKTTQYISQLALEDLEMAERLFSHGDTRHDRFRLFLHAVQAVCYIMCWHIEKLAETDDKGQVPLHQIFDGCAEAGIKALNPVLENVINPLSLINKQVAQQFLCCLRHVSLDLENRYKQRVETRNLTTYMREGEDACLDVFFPFDPYRLRHSSIFVIGKYKEWDGPDVDEDSQSEADDEHPAHQQITAQDGFLATEDVKHAAAGSKKVQGERMETDRSDVNTNMEDTRFAPQIAPSPAFGPRSALEAMAEHQDAQMMCPGSRDEDTMDMSAEDFQLPAAAADPNDPIDGVDSRVDTRVDNAFMKELLSSGAYAKGQNEAVP